MGKELKGNIDVLTNSINNFIDPSVSLINQAQTSVDLTSPSVQAMLSKVHEDITYGKVTKEWMEDISVKDPPFLEGMKNVYDSLVLLMKNIHPKIIGLKQDDASWYKVIVELVEIMAIDPFCVVIEKICGSK